MQKAVGLCQLRKLSKDLSIHDITFDLFHYVTWSKKAKNLKAIYIYIYGSAISTKNIVFFIMRNIAFLVW